MKILFDGWPLAFEAGSPPALHLLDLLALLPPHVEGLLAAPAALEVPLPVSVRLLQSGHSPGARFSWEQIALPRLAQHSGAAALHMTGCFAPLFSRVPVILSPGAPVKQGKLIAERAGGRLRAAFGRGGQAAAAALLWPDDLPSPTPGGPPVMRLPLAAPPARHPAHRPSLEDSNGYVAAFGNFEDDQSLLALVDTWRWAGPAMGEGWQLRVACRPNTDMARFANQLEALRTAAGLPGALAPAPVVTRQQMQDLLAGAGAALHMGPLCAWGDALPPVLAAGCPLAAEETWGVDARVGPAAYLAPPGDWRALGAAVLTLLVEETVAEPLSQAALERAAAWQPACFSNRLGELYAAVCRR